MRAPHHLLRSRIQELLESALDSLQKIEGRPAAHIEPCQNEKFGHYVCNSAMGRQLRDLYGKIDPTYRNPQAFADALKTALKNDAGAAELLESVEVAAPGFINLRIRPAIFLEYMSQALREQDRFGTIRQKNARRIIFEYVSANPTGPLNIVSARAAALGDCCANLLTAIGDDVVREYYVNDHGNQVILLGQSAFLRYLELRGCKLKFPRPAASPSYGEEAGLPFPEQGYRGDYLIEAVGQLLAGERQLKLELELEPLLLQELLALSQSNRVDPSFLDRKDLAQKSEHFGLALRGHFIESHREILRQFRVHFDSFFQESSLHKNNSLPAAKELLADFTYNERGRLLFASSRLGDDKDRVLIREDGRPTYLLADIAYHHNKIERGFTHIFNIFGPDHHGYIARLRAALQALRYQGAFKALIVQQVNLLEDGRPVRMSKRSGKLITMQELLQEIPVDVSRYFFIMRSFEAHLDFDMAVARNSSDQNPYYYIAYAHARICSIFRKSAERGLLPAKEMQREQGGRSKALAATARLAAIGESEESGESGESNLFPVTPERERLLFYIARFPEEVYDAAIQFAPHRLLLYLYNLAAALSRFYGPKENRIIEQEPRLAGQLLALLQGVAHCLKNGLALLGMEAPERL